MPYGYFCSDFEDIIVFIDNILLFTKSAFEHHVNKLNMVLQVIQKNNIHIHIERVYLASKKVDYLGYTLKTIGVEPQVKKIAPILSFAPPATKKQLRGFLGFVNYYKKLWHHSSHTLEPLTRVFGSKTKFIWTEEQDKAFKSIKKIMARKKLLSYPDFSKPFDIFTDASEYQLGGVITQSGMLIAFYSRKLNNAQCNYTTMEK